jgi:hypothetical protein
MLRFAILISLSGMFAVSAHGEVRDWARSANSAFAEGRYKEAVRLTEASENANGHALAARALLAEAMCSDAGPTGQTLDRAEDFARSALEKEPDHVEGRLQLAIVLSLRTREMSRSQAWRTGYGPQARDLVAGVLEDEPGNAYAHGFLAVWHVEVVRRAGSLGAAMMDASLSQGLLHYAEAARLSPDDASLHWQMARALAAHNPRRHRDRIESALDAAIRARGDTALESVMARRAEVLSEALVTLDANGVRRLALGML